MYISDLVKDKKKKENESQRRKKLPKKKNPPTDSYGTARMAVTHNKVPR